MGIKPGLWYRWEGGGSYLQNFQVVYTLEGEAWDIPQLIPWDTPKRETSKIIKVKNRNTIIDTKKVTSLKRRAFFTFIYVFYSILFGWGCDVTSSQTALGLLLGQYANKNFLFPSVWLLLARGTPWNLNQFWERRWVSKDWIEWDWVNKCTA